MSRGRELFFKAHDKFQNLSANRPLRQKGAVKQKQMLILLFFTAPAVFFLDSAKNLSQIALAKLCGIAL